MVVFYVVTMLYWFSMYTYVPILSPYVQHLGGSLSMVGLVVGSYGVTQMLVRIPLGIMSDRLGRRKPFVTLGLLLTLISSLGLGLATNPTWALVFRGIAGIAAGTWVAYSVLFSSYFPPEQAARAMGLITFYMTLGQTIASSLGGILTDYWGWPAPFFVGAAAAGLGLILTRKVVEKESSSTAPIDLAGLQKVGSDRSLLQVSTLAIILQALAFATVHGFTPSYAVGLGASGTQLSILALVSALPTAIVSLNSGRFVERYGERKLLFVGILLVAGTVIAIPLSTNLWALFITQAIGAAGRGASFPVLMGLSIKSVAVEYRATAMGFFQSIYALGMVAGPVITGVLGDGLGLQGSFIILGIVGLLTAGLALLWIPAPKVLQ